MLRSPLRASMKARHSGALPVIAVVALIAIAACDPAASPSSTSGLGPSSTATQPSAAVVAPPSTPGPVRPPGVPGNAQPLLFGCKEGLARCTDIAPGTYYTAGEWALLPGLTFTLPAGWSSLSNEAGELELHATADGTNDIMIWRDVVPWVDGRAAIELASDPEAWIARLASDPRLEVSEPERVVLGRDLQAIAVRLRIAKDAANEETDCPGTACVKILIDATHWGEAFSIGRDQMDESGCPCTAEFRFYFTSIGYPSHPHLLVVALTAFGPNADGEADMANLQAAAQPILDSLIVPAVIVDN